MRTARVAAVAALLVLPGAIAACADILSIQEPIPMTSAESSIQTGAIAYEGGLVIDPFNPACGDGGGDAAGPPSTESVFVSLSPQANSEGTCGSRQSPCNSVSIAIERAKAAGSETVVVARGLYEETLVLVPSVTIQGGWDEDFTWICDPEAVQIRAPSGSYTTVLGNDIGSATTLENLTVSSTSNEAPPTPTIPSASGISVYGIFLTGSSFLTLSNVVVVTGPAGNGANVGAKGAQGDAGAPSGCDPGDGGNGGTGGAGAPGQMGSFGATGYTALVGGSGDIGTAGGNSSSGACGGQPGQGGLGGGGGGSSIAVYLNDGALISSTNALFQAGNGGNGGAGGLGGIGGDPGGAGAGQGGSGGIGGGGAGGNSFALVYATGRTGSMTHDTVLMYGMGGTGGGSGATTGQSGLAGGATEE
jgi:hypothetical protein